MKKSEISLLCGFVLTVVISLVSHQLYDAQQVRQNTLRLHIIANSNSQQDQNIKLNVRDIILAHDEALAVNADTFSQAVNIAQENTKAIENRVNEYLETVNVPYTAKCSVESFYFDTTQYDGFVLPKGEYAAFTVRLGEAVGKNWWCVMYPALCSRSCGEVQLENSDGFIKTSKITPRFKIVEVYENIKTKLFGIGTDQYENLD